MWKCAGSDLRFALLAFADTKRRRAADIQRAGLTEGLKEPVEEDLRLPLFVAGDVLLRPRDEAGKLFLASHGGGV